MRNGGNQDIIKLHYYIVQGKYAVREFAKRHYKHFVEVNFVKQPIAVQDFIIEENGRITILEVKSGEDFKKHASLNNAIINNTMHIERSIVLSKFNIEVDNGIIYLPLYLLGLIKLG